MENRDTIRKLVFSALFLALGLLLPFLTGQIPQIGSKLSPMHIPVLLCGFVCGWKWGLIVGAVVPLLRSALFGMPPMMPTAAAMAFELAAYGFAAGMLYKLLPKTAANVYAALVGAMIVGRIVWGAAAFALNSAMGAQFGWQAFAAGAVLNAVPGIILHIAIIPPIVLALRRAGVMKKEG
ncbi:MAG: ECF transporter S component [Eubacteriales bacterium]|nr:ECF transporter S component [Eubacteriales bacterium]